MDCVTECPDTAILGKVVPKAQLEAELAAIPDEAEAINRQLDHMHAHHPHMAWLQRERAVQAARQGRLEIRQDAPFAPLYLQAIPT